MNFRSAKYGFRVYMGERCLIMNKIICSSLEWHSDAYEYLTKVFFISNYPDISEKNIAKARLIYYYVTTIEVF